MVSIRGCYKMKIKRLLAVILIGILMVFMAIHLDKQDKKIAILKCRIETLEENVHTLETKLRSQRLMSFYHTK